MKIHTFIRFVPRKTINSDQNGLIKNTVTIDETFPCYLKNNINKFKKFIL